MGTFGLARGRVGAVRAAVVRKFVRLVVAVVVDE